MILIAAFALLLSKTAENERRRGTILEAPIEFIPRDPVLRATLFRSLRLYLPFLVYLLPFMEVLVLSRRRLEVWWWNEGLEVTSILELGD